jgi:eukaryotic-like serine/threonine-protein kinase
MSTAADVRVGNLRLPERYRVMRRIASGATATVWCAEDNVLGRSVAIKVLSESYSQDQAATTRFEREARAAARLSGHPNVVTIYDVGEARHHDTVCPFLVMEFLSGGTVAEALRAGPVNRGEAVSWLHEAARALDFAHDRGVIHRDIKPANFLLDRDRTLHVADFGIARLGTEDAITTSGDVLATVAYVAPERVHGVPASYSSDLYAFAVAAFELLVGERPFTATHIAAQLRQHAELPPPRASARNATLPPALDAVLMRGMAKRPEDRWRTATEFADAVEQAMSKRPAGGVQPAPPGAWTPMAKSGPIRRPRRGLVVAALLAAVLAGISVAAATQGSAPKPAKTAASGIHRPRVHRARRASKTSSSPTAASPPGSGTTSSATPSPDVPIGAPSSSQPSSPTTNIPAGASAGPVGAPTTSTSSPPSPPAANIPAGAAAAVGGRHQPPTALEDEGHRLMVAGDYRAAIPVLRRAVATADRSSLTYAFALYDLGRSLRLNGEPQAAIPILRKRLEIPDQRGVVKAELDAAIREASKS